MARVAFSAFGSWGDLFPLIPVAEGMRARGHDVFFAMTPAARDVVEGEGFPLVPVGPTLGFEEYARRPEILDPRFRGVASFRNLFRYFILPHLPDVYSDLRRVCDGVDLLVSDLPQLAAPMVAESLELPWATVLVFPGLVPSRHSVPQLAPFPPLTTPPGRALNALTWSVTLMVMRRLFDRPVNDVRAAVGLPRTRNAFPIGCLSPHRVIVATSEVLVARPPDWPERFTTAGFSYWDRSKALSEPEDLDSFLDAGTPPLVFTVGSSVAVDPQAFFDLAIGILERTGRRGVLLLAHDMNKRRAPKDVAVWTYAPLSRLLPRSELIVHHAGFSTTAAALLNGVPQVVLPRAFDQFDLARGVKRLGAGRVVPWTRMNAKTLHGAVSSVLSDPSYRSRARAISSRLAVEDGSRRACDELEDLLESAGRGRVPGGS